jgi:hypothetical protein
VHPACGYADHAQRGVAGGGSEGVEGETRRTLVKVDSSAASFSCYTSDKSDYTIDISCILGRLLVSEHTMQLMNQIWYLLPDGTRVQAHDIGGSWRLDSPSGEPLYILNHLGFSRFVRNGKGYQPSPCDLTIDDLRPEGYK